MKTMNLKITENELLDNLMFTKDQIHKGFLKLKKYNYFPDEIDELITSFNSIAIA